jgi:hypothetical protein
MNGEPPMQRPAVLLLSVFSTLTACTGLVAGPETAAVAPVRASRDSVYGRARRAVQTEAFTLDIADSLGGRITGTRYASSSAQMGSSAACRVHLALQIQGDPERAQVAATSRWLAPEPMEALAPEVCEKERTDVLARVSQTIEPALAP